MVAKDRIKKNTQARIIVNQYVSAMFMGVERNREKQK